MFKKVVPSVLPGDLTLACLILTANVFYCEKPCNDDKKHSDGKNKTYLAP